MSAVPLPWHILSPNGVWHLVRSEPLMRQLADIAHIPRSNFMQLVGKNKNSSAPLPQHKGGWQIRQRVSWIEREAFQLQDGTWLGSIPPMPFSSADGDTWVVLYFSGYGGRAFDAENCVMVRCHWQCTGRLWSSGFAAAAHSKPAGVA